MNHTRPEPQAEGVPALRLRDEDRETLEDVLAEVLIAALEHDMAIVEVEAARR